MLKLFLHKLTTNIQFHINVKLRPNALITKIEFPPGVDFITMSTC